jgi:hypothetical protein
VHGLEEVHLDREEVARQQLRPVPAQEGPPGVAASPTLRGRRDMMPLEDIPHSRAADRVAQLAQLAVDPAVPPAASGGRPAARLQPDPPGMRSRAPRSARPYPSPSAAMRPSRGHCRRRLGGTGSHGGTCGRHFYTLRLSGQRRPRQPADGEQWGGEAGEFIVAVAVEDDAALATALCGERTRPTCRSLPRFT